LNKKQNTIEKEMVLEGAGIHTGKKCVLRLVPAPPDTGVVFVRTDLPDNPEVEARFDNLVPTSRRTSLAANGARVETVEHLLAAMFVLCVDNCRVEINSAELPALDGSGLPYYNLLISCGVCEVDASARMITVETPVEVRSGDAFIKATPAPALSVSYRLSYPSVGLEQQFACAINPATFAEDIAPARTFVLEEEINKLVQAGYGKGANEDNTVVLTSEGPRGELRMANEPARHKVLDLLGDVFYLGGRLLGRIECERSGHSLNRELVKALLEG